MESASAEVNMPDDLSAEDAGTPHELWLGYSFSDLCQMMKYILSDEQRARAEISKL